MGRVRAASNTKDRSDRYRKSSVYSVKLNVNRDTCVICIGRRGKSAQISRAVQQQQLQVGRQVGAVVILTIIYSLRNVSTAFAVDVTHCTRCPFFTISHFHA